MPRFSSYWRRAARMKASESATLRVWPTNGIQFARCARLASISANSSSRVAVVELAQRAAVSEVDFEHRESLAYAARCASIGGAR